MTQTKQTDDVKCAINDLPPSKMRAVYSLDKNREDVLRGIISM